MYLYCFKRAAFRALSAPSTSFLLKPRSITTVTPSALRITRQIPNLAFQQRWYSDEVRQSEEAESNASEKSSTTGVFDGSSLFEENRGSSRSSADFEEQPLREQAPRETQRRPPMAAEPNETVYIGNLFFDITAEDLKEAFKDFGVVQTAKVIHDNRGLSRGFAYVTFDSADSAAKAIEGMHLQVFEGRRLTVQYSANKLQRDTIPPRHPPSKTLFIGNMSFEMTDTDLNTLFKDIRNVIDVRVAVDRRTGTPRGFAHADFVDTESAMEAYEALKGKSPYGRKLRLDYSFTNRNQATKD
ncbi:hypothetical protein FQN54_003397 [Arachnomyces sp. PD_36]|nr:hypothetical protein FQN54_003397 [Arachnomyces sp. PD_36]